MTRLEYDTIKLIDQATALATGFFVTRHAGPLNSSPKDPLSNARKAAAYILYRRYGILQKHIGWVLGLKKNSTSNIISQVNRSWIKTGQYDLVNRINSIIDLLIVNQCATQKKQLRDSSQYSDSWKSDINHPLQTHPSQN